MRGTGLDSGRWTNSENRIILCVIHHLQNLIESNFHPCYIADINYEKQRVFWEISVVIQSITSKGNGYFHNRVYVSLIRYSKFRGNTFKL
jgi:hypothetical protein